VLAAGGALDAALESFGSLYAAQGSPSVGLLFLGPEQAPVSSGGSGSLALAVPGVAVVGSYESASEQVAGLPAWGSYGEAAQALQEQLLAAGLRLADLPTAALAPDAPALAAELLIEVRTMPDEHMAQVQVRLLESDSGRILTVARHPAVEPGDPLLQRSAVEQALAAALTSLVADPAAWEGQP